MSQNTLPLVLRIITERDTEKAWAWKFKDFMYLSRNWLKDSIQGSIEKGIIKIWAIDHTSRKELYNTLRNDSRENIEISVSTWWFFVLHQHAELTHIIEEAATNNKNIVSVKWWSAWCLSAYAQWLWYNNPKYADALCNIPEQYTQDFIAVQKNFAYIAWAAMIPFLTKIKLYGHNDIQIWNNKKDQIVDFLVMHFQDIFTQVQSIIWRSDFNTWAGLLSDENIQTIITHVIRTHKKDFLQSLDIQEDKINLEKIEVKKITNTEYQEMANFEVHPMVAVNKKWEYIDQDHELYTLLTPLDLSMCSSNVWSAFRLETWGKTYELRDPYFKTKTGLEKEFRTINKENIRLWIVTLNRFRLNPAWFLPKTWIVRASNELYADYVLAIDWHKTNSLQKAYIPDIKQLTNEFMWDDSPYHKQN